MSFVMHKLRKAIVIFFGASLVFSLLSADILAEEGKIELDIGDHTLSAAIKEAPLRGVIAKIKEEMQGVRFKLWLKRSKTSLDEKISVQFENLPIQKGMVRIFSTMNYSLIFDKYSKLLGVFLLGKPAKARGRAKRRSVAPRRKITRRGPGRYVRRK